jgi:hypothetical protein
MDYSEIFITITIIIMIFLIGFKAVYLSEIKPKLDNLYTKFVRLEQKVANVEHEWGAHKQKNARWVEQINKDLSIESLNKIMQQHIEGTSMPIKDKIEEAVEEYNAHLKELKSKAFRSTRQSGIIGEIIVYEDDIDYIMFTMRNKYGNSKKGS